MVERYLACLAAHDWDGLAATIADEGRVSFVELTESFEADGESVTWPECLLFERDDVGLIAHVSVFFKQRGSSAR
jgi:hypothetical protein